MKKSPDILKTFSEKLSPLDIKTVNSYIIDATTHIVSNKRNIPKGLQALVNGKHIVTEDYIGSIVGAAISEGTTDEGAHLLSLLEQDFDSNWPDARRYLPGPGKEPIPRAAEDFAPNPNRINVFEGFTFVFGYASQFETLSPALTNGSAKTLHYELKNGVTRAEDLAQYVRNVADKKGLQDVYDRTLPKGVVVVRPPGVDEKMDEWTRELFTQLDLELEQRSVWQNEFLDAILRVDASPLKRSIIVDQESSRAPASTAPEPAGRSRIPPRGVQEQQKQPSPVRNDEQGASQAPQATPPIDSSQASPSRAKGRIRRTVTKSRFKGFDDFDDEEPIMPSKLNMSPVREEDEGHNEPDTQKSSAMEVDSQPLFVSDSRSQSVQPNGTPAPNQPSKKRPRPSEEDNEPDSAAMMDSLLPGAAAMKKRRLEQQNTTNKSQASAPEPPLSKREAAKRQKQKDFNVRQAAQTHAQKLDAERENRSYSRAQSRTADDYEEIDTAAMGSLAIIETMDVPVRNPRPGAQQNGTNRDTNGALPNPRWDDRWNGLKNFKNFRRKGANTVDAGNRARKVFVKLDEVKRKDFGIGESYWLESSSSKSGRKSKNQSQSQSQAQAHSQSQTQRARTRAEEEEDMDLAVDGDEVAGTPRDSRFGDALAAGRGERQTQRPRSAAGKKRAVPGRGPVREPPAKRQRQGRLANMREQEEEEEEESSDEEGGLKFKFSRKR